MKENKTLNVSLEEEREDMNEFGSETKMGGIYRKVNGKETILDYYFVCFWDILSKLFINSKEVESVLSKVYVHTGA
ncbi:hypothetical protein SAMN05216391_11753 [Lachnospiraceae bacterium KHCPX20]|nr:hypothetical protein SAMN05216391_11753 [Lachnospiraceae bacterium KHCPX20]